MGFDDDLRDYSEMFLPPHLLTKLAARLPLHLVYQLRFVYLLAIGDYGDTMGTRLFYDGQQQHVMPECQCSGKYDAVLAITILH